jgi:GntR family transcriptional regulator, rspAB operon transcriptional repressor
MRSVRDRLVGVSARDQVYLRLREEIVTAVIEPGRRVSENELADRLGVSRTPVREALQRLADERLVAVVPQLGTFVTRISVGSVDDAAFVREALEGAAIRLATARVAAGEASLEGVHRNLAAQDAAVAEDDTEAFDALDEELHRSLCDAAGHEIAWSLARRANGHLDRVRRLGLPEPGFLETLAAEHRAIVAAVAEGDEERAATTLSRHLRTVLSSVPAIRAAHPDYFEDPQKGSD